MLRFGVGGLCVYSKGSVTRGGNSRVFVDNKGSEILLGMSREAVHVRFYSRCVLYCRDAKCLGRMCGNVWYRGAGSM